MKETIVSIATALSSSGIGIIRISGEEAVEIADRIFRKPNRKKLSEVSTHTVHYGHIVDEDGTVVDEVIVILMKAPHSFTKEDVVEIDCHGGIFLLKQVLNLCVKAGARLAEPGEFTKRAFLNGRIDLSEAEAVMDLISSSNEAARRNSIGQLSGRLHRKIVSLREKLIYEIAFIESAIDDPEHYDTGDFINRLTDVVDSCEEELKKLLLSFENGKYLVSGINCTIVGKPNVGKSSFMNLLLGEDRAIVTAVAGTTRDTLEETISLDGITLHLVDTAGIHETEDEVEKIGVKRAKESIERAELVFFVLDSSDKISAEDLELTPLLSSKKVIVLLNKSDLNLGGTTEEDVEKAFSGRIENMRILSFSAKTSQGLTELTDVIKDLFYHGELNADEELYLTSIRHKTLVENADMALLHVKESLQMNMPEDFYAIDLMQCYSSLGEIIGEEVDDDLVDEIFSKFCMGK